MNEITYFRKESTDEQYISSDEQFEWKPLSFPIFRKSREVNLKMN